MVNKLLKGVMWVVGLALVVLVCWLAVMYWAWPLWALIPLLLGVLVASWIVLALRRQWISWRLRRKLARDMPAVSSEVDVTLFDQQWKAGLQVLREARLGGRTASLYALPWVLSINVGVSNDDDGFRAQAIRQVRADPAQPLSGVSWYFLKACVVLGTRMVPSDAQTNSAASAAWQRLLFRLLRTRRREPLNGVVFNIDTGWLQQASDADLKQAGQALRAQHDDLSRVFNARIPVWVVLTHAEQISGFYPWSQSLDASLRDQPFGYTSPTPQHDEQGSPDFVRAAFASVLARLSDLRLALGQQGPLSAPVFELPQRVAELQPRLERMLVPAFDATPYAATPLLRGLYWTSTHRQAGVAESLFMRDLFDHVFPLQRHSWQGLDRLGSWRRVLRHAMVIGWGIVAAALVVGLLYASRSVHQDINTLAARQLYQLEFAGSLEEDLQELNIWHDATVKLAESNRGLSSLQPFRSHLSDLEIYYKNAFVQLYKDEIKRDFMDQMVVHDLPGVARNGTDTEIAAWAQYLVRRINMIRARLEGKSLSGMPVPGPELAQLYHSSALKTVGLQTGVLIGQLYTDYLTWQTERTQLQGELDGLNAALRQLGLSSRSTEWLLAWAEFQSDLRAVTLSDFWGVPASDGAPSIPAGLTKEGTQAITDFGLELARASGEHDVWEERVEVLSERFTDAAYDAWYRFMSAFDEGRLYLDDESAWRTVLSSTFSRQDPHLKLLGAISELFSRVPASEQPEWVAAAINLERVLLASELTQQENTGFLDQARTANALGHAGIQAMSQGVSIEGSLSTLREGMAAVQEMKAYREQVTAAVKQLLQGQGSALELARQTWSYGRDPEVKTSPLHEAQEHYERMRVHAGDEATREGAVWELLHGPLSFALDYTARSAACGLQQDWDATVLGAVQNVRSQILAYDLLYGDRGSVPAFMQGTVQHFLERDALGYSPRQALGHSIPLTGEFYSYVGGVQIKQVSHGEQKLRDEQSEKARTVELEALREQQAELEKQAQAMEALKAVVSIETAAPLVSPGATVLPQRTSLTLQCASRATTLENYNFPTRAVFEWSQNECADTTLSIQFPAFTLTKSYPGPDGFVAFLQDFSAGQRQFSASDFPDKRQELENAGVHNLTISWRIQGHETLLRNAEQSGQLAAQTAEVTARVAALREQQAGPSPDEHVVEDIRDIVPERIVSACWTSSPRSGTEPEPAVVSTTVAARMQEVSSLSSLPDMSEPDQGDAARASQSEASQTAVSVSADAAHADAGTPSASSQSWYVQVGVFADPTQAQQRLEGLSIAHDTVTLERRSGTPLYSVKTMGYATQEQAQSVAVQISQGLNLSPQVLRAVR